jgi:hypothetical protein
MLRKLRALEKKRQSIMLELLSMNKMVWGSFCLIHVKCGTKGCQCATGKLHPHHRMSWRENGKDLSRAVPKEEYEWIEKMTGNYRKFKQLRKQLKELTGEMNTLLDTYVELVVKKTRKGKEYLEI